MEVYRIQKDKHRDTILTGEGARLYGGRWNSEGIPLVYTSSSMELALLETTVHFEGTPPADLPDYIVVTILIPSDAVTYLDPATLPDGWQSYEGYPASRLNEFIQQEFRRTGSLGLAVPSVIMPHSSGRNVLLNPLHPRMSEVTITAISPNDIDPRLL